MKMPSSLKSIKIPGGKKLICPMFPAYLDPQTGGTVFLNCIEDGCRMWSMGDCALKGEYHTMKTGGVTIAKPSN